MPAKHTHKKHIQTLLFIIISLLASPLHGQHITLRDVPSQDKLPVNAIHRIFQDSDGYMWYGTFNGLCRYDGYNIRVFRSDLTNPGLLANNYITYIAEDHEKNIWFGTREGVYTFNKLTNTISPIDLGEVANKDVFSINVTRDGTIWVSTHGSLFRFRADGSLIRSYEITYRDNPRFVYIVYENNDDDLLISLTGGGMHRLNKATDTFEAYHHHPEYMDIERIIWDDIHACYWLGTWGKGIVRFNPRQTDAGKQYVSQPLPVDILGKPVANLFHMVQDDTFHYLWVTTERDLFAFRITDQCTLEQVDTSSFLATGNKMLYEIYKDRGGKLWVSAFDMPSFIVDIREYTVKDYPLQSLRDKIKANPAILSLCVDSRGSFWITQERYGLYAYNPDTEQVIHYLDCADTRHLPFWEVSQIVPSHRGNSVWALPNGTVVYELKYENGEIKTGTRLNLTDVTADPGNNTFLYEDRQQNLWIGTTTSLFRYHTATGQLELIAEDLGQVTHITQTQDEQIWVLLKNKGIAVSDSGEAFKIHPFTKDFNCMDTTSDGKLWLGTGEGEVFLFDPETEALTDYSQACGMKGDIVNNIVVDVYNHVWIATNQMIKEYNPRNGAYRSYNTRNDNFLLDRLLSRAVYYDRRGEIYWVSRYFRCMR